VPAVHTGPQHALRSAISSAANNYDYLGTVDSDDLLVPETLAATVAILDRYPAIGMVYTDHQIQNISRSRHEQQVELSATAVRNALVRRGLSDQYRLEVIEGDRFQIVQQD
jgi:cellulose synthase/poly-beta-1,6-N-acetylglucosamine synthase-like glycosyltransferase